MSAVPPIGDKPVHRSEMTRCAINVASRRSKSARYSIISSARTNALGYAHFSRSRIDLPITQSLSCSERNGSSSVK